METFKVLIRNSVGSDYVGPFLFGTISPSSCDDGAVVWSADGLVGLNLGVVTYHEDACDTTMNMIVVMEDVLLMTLGLIMT
uniref:Uncharacterized protein n=1 Tax=Meloidogyne floridensis TaxID=298350 RepID=A0A915NKL8_9BILA